jgi:hypothetical protein
MTSGRFFNRGVMTLDCPYIGYVVRETDDKIIVFGQGNDRYDILKSVIQMTSRNVLIGLSLYEVVKKYRVTREEPLPTEEWIQGMNLDLAAYERKYPKPLFNKGVRIENEDSIGHIMRETDDRIIIFGSYDYRFDVPKSKIKEVGRNVILSLDYSELFKYKVDKSAPLPTVETKEKLVV